MKYTLQHCCEKNKNGIIFVNNVFRIVQIMVNKVTFVGLGVAIALPQYTPLTA